MVSARLNTQTKLPRVIQLLRAPVGGLFRHASDLIREQHKLGLKLGLICDSTNADSRAASVLADLEPACELGIYHVPMDRSLGFSDVKTLTEIAKICSNLHPDIIHGHGAKGGAYARLVANHIGAKSIYTPHGGSLHFSARSPIGFVYLSLEQILRGRSDGIIFESQFGADSYVKKIGKISCAYQIIHNGLNEEEFLPLSPNSDAKTFVFLGELRKLKGLEVLLQAVYKLKSHRKVSLLMAGSGPDADFLQRRIKELGLEECITLSSPIYPATDAFAQGKCVVMPSLAESFPYVVLEATAAKIPLLTTNVGGIPEIFGPYADKLLTPGNPDALADAMAQFIEAPEQANKLAEELHAHVKQHFKIEAMVGDVIHFYEQVLIGTGVGLQLKRVKN
jgi:glycosyltransferase involved in cell wall biosynthesis